MHARANANARIVAEWVERTPSIEFLTADRGARSNTSICLKLVDPRVTALSNAQQAQFARDLAALLESENVALDAAAYRSAPPGLRIWCGATVESDDVAALLPSIEWAFTSCVNQLKV